MQQGYAGAPPEPLAQPGFDRRTGAQQQPGGRRVMRLQRARRPESGVRRAGGERRADDGLQRSGRDGARPKQDRLPADEAEDGGFQPYAASAAVEDQIHSVTEFIPHMPGLGRADPAEAVGGGRGDAATEGVQQRERHGVMRHPQAHAVLAAGHGQRRLATAEDQRQRPRPEGLRQPPGDRRNVPRPALQQRRRADMDDQRVIGGPALEGENPAHGVRVAGVRAESVNRLGRERYDAASAEACGGLLDEGVLGHVGERCFSAVPCLSG